MTRTTTSQVAFAVDPVKPGTTLLPTEKVKGSIEKLLGSPVEACDNYHADVVQQPGFHSLIAAAHMAYQNHFPLVLSPDVIWLTLAQGLAGVLTVEQDKTTHAIRPRIGWAVREVAKVV